MHESKPLSRVRSLQLALAAGLALAAFSPARTAHASPDYPPELAKALKQEFQKEFCVPQCISCHVTNEGGRGTMNVFGMNLQLYGSLFKGMPETVVPAVQKYFKAVPPPTAPQVSTMFMDGTTRPFFDSDLDGLSDYTELQNFDSPSLPLPRGDKEFCPDIEYGCFARVAAAPPPADRWGLLSAGLVMLGLAAFRRLNRSPRAG
jgi:hypothetical protein